MTLKARTNLNLSLYCDKVLEFFYFRKSNGLIEVDQVDQELLLPYEHCELAIKKLKNDDFLEIVENFDGKFAQITTKGEIHYRTTSYKKESAKINSSSIIEKFRVLKDIVQFILFSITIFLSIYTLKIDKELVEIKKEIKILNENNLKIDSLKRELLK